jgi:hypothetical protein
MEETVVAANLDIGHYFECIFLIFALQIALDECCWTGFHS